MQDLKLFIDGSVDPRTKIGFGGYRLVDEERIPSHTSSGIRFAKFENTSSTKLEVQTLIHALQSIGTTPRRIIVYTDSQNIARLPERRERLEKNAYRSRSGAHIRHYKLYQEFYTWMDRLPCRIVKLKGHKPKSEKDAIDELFTLVDRAARKAMRSAS